MSGAYSFLTFRTTPNRHSNPFLRNVLGAKISTAPVRSGITTIYTPSPSLPSSSKSKSLTAKDRFSLRFPHLNTDYYTQITKNLLSILYPKNCPTCKIPLSKEVSTRENVIRCPECNYLESRTSGTPLEHLKLPLWVFSYLLIESIELFPLGFSASAICRKLSVSKNTGTLLKRRLQIFCSDLIPLIKDEMVKDLKKSWIGKKLPESGDLKHFIEGKPSQLFTLIR